MIGAIHYSLDEIDFGTLSMTESQPPELSVSVLNSKADPMLISNVTIDPPSKDLIINFNEIVVQPNISKIFLNVSYSGMGVVFWRRN